MSLEYINDTVKTLPKASMFLTHIDKYQSIIFLLKNKSKTTFYAINTKKLRTTCHNQDT
jgi:hypothetical protein